MKLNEKKRENLREKEDKGKKEEWGTEKDKMGSKRVK